MARYFLMTIKVCATLGALPFAVGRSSSGLRQHSGRGDAVVDGNVVQGSSLTVQAPPLEQHLVICNAYASPKPLDVTRVRTRQSVTTGLAYKQCRELSLPLEEGEELDFTAGGLDVGTFYATGVPRSAASLLLIPHRRSPHAVGVSFQSHAFSEVHAPQVAVIDAYRGKGGKQEGAIKIMENLPAADGKSPATRVEENLKFNSVVALNPGRYEVSLAGMGSNATTRTLNAAEAGRYVVMRLGVDNGDQYPQELVVFPNGALRAATFFSFVSVAIACALPHLSGVM